MKNFVELTGELVCSSWDRFIAFIRGVLYHRINDESLNKYFYRGQDDNNKVVLNMIAGGSYGEFTYAEIAENLGKICQKNKSWSTRRLETGRNTLAVHDTNNQPIDEIREEMSQIRTGLGLVLKHLNGGSEKVNAVNYLTRFPPPLE